MNTNKVFMAFSKGKESTEATSVKRYVGIAPVTILAVNPNKAALEKIYDTTIENEIEYAGELEVNGKKVPQVRIDFIVNTCEDKCGINMKSKVSFYVADSPRYNKDMTKVQVINKYGETTWLSIEDAKAKHIPDNLSWFEPADFRPVFIGEENLTNFIKNYLNIPNKSYRKANGEVVELADKSEAEARLDNIKNYFKGDFSELKDIINLRPDNRIKVMFGVKTTEDNKQYQAVFIEKTLKNSATKDQYVYVDKVLQERKENGAYATTEFFVGDLKEYVVEPTKFKKEETADPFASQDNPWGIQY